MSSMEAITPEQKDLPCIGFQLDEQIKNINEAIFLRKWHNSFTDTEEVRNNYYAILLYEYDDVTNEELRKQLVEIYTKKGWDCMQKYCYDARGPHYCFYVNKKHFI